MSRIAKIALLFFLFMMIAGVSFGEENKDSKPEVTIDVNEKDAGGFVLYSGYGETLSFRTAKKEQYVRFEKKTVPFMIDFIDYKNHSVLEVEIGGNKKITFVMRK